MDTVRTGPHREASLLLTTGHLRRSPCRLAMTGDRHGAIGLDDGLDNDPPVEIGRRKLRSFGQTSHRAAKRVGWVNAHKGVYARLRRAMGA